MGTPSRRTLFRGAPAASVPVLPGVSLAGFHTEAAMLRSLAHAALRLGKARKAGQARRGVSQRPGPGPGLGGQAADHRAEGRNAGRWLELDDRRPGIASRRALRLSPGGFPHRKKCLRAASASSAGRPAWARTGPGRCGCRGTRHRHGRNRWRCRTGGRRRPRTAARPSRGCAGPWSRRRRAAVLARRRDRLVSRREMAVVVQGRVDHRQRGEPPAGGVIALGLHDPRPLAGQARERAHRIDVRSRTYASLIYLFSSHAEVAGAACARK